jgi:hypothetical protein
MAEPLILVVLIIALVVLTMTYLSTDKDQKPHSAQTVEPVSRKIIDN